MEAPAIGIDLGTTYSCVAVYHKGKVHVIPNPEQGADLTTPSYVFFEPEGDPVVGEPAKSNAHRNPENTIYDVKRILGREFNNPELQNDMKFWPFTVKQGDDEEKDIPMVKVNEELLYPEEISAKLLAKLKSFAETYLQLEAGSIKKAVITVPAYFHDGQRQATIDAGELAGLEVLTILNEPTAAAIAYSMERTDTKPQNVLIYDLGGGTFDVAVLNMEPGKIEVLGVNGDTHLGGEDFDKNLMEFCLSQFKTENDVDLLELKDSTDGSLMKKAKRCLRRLKTQCEAGKKVLTSGVKATISVDAFYDGEDLVVNVKRPQFEEMNMTHFEKTIEMVDATLTELGLSKTDIDDIVLVGGSTRIPKVQELLKDFFQGKLLNSSIHPDQAVAYGAAVQAALMTSAKGKSLARLQFHKISDVTPMAVGIMDAVSAGLDAHIPKNTTLPAKLSFHCMTEEDHHTIMTFQIYQGNDVKVAENNRWLGSFDLTGIPRRRKGQETIELIEVTMEINEMGVLHVEAVCQSNQRSGSITIVENKNRMSQETKNRLLSKTNNPSSTEGLGPLTDNDEVEEMGPKDHDIEVVS